jgi:PAS domain S-box-containing protein
LENSVQGHLKQLLVDSLEDCALVVLDPAGTVLSWNAGARRLLGYDESEVVGLTFAGLVPPESLDESGAPAALARARQNGRQEQTCRRLHRDGTTLVLREVVIALRDGAQNVVAFGLMMQSLEAARHAEASAAGRELALAARKAPRVLVVDDDDVVRAMAIHLLEDLGYDVLSAAGGPEALAILGRDASIDLLFTDVVMPGMDGGELAEQAERLRPDIKVLFTSGYFQHALIRKGNITPNTNLLVKPYRRQDLARKLSAILSGERAQPGERLPGGA